MDKFVQVSSDGYQMSVVGRLGDGAGEVPSLMSEGMMGWRGDPVQ